MLWKKSSFGLCKDDGKSPKGEDFFFNNSFIIVRAVDLFKMSMPFLNCSVRASCKTRGKDENVCRFTEDSILSLRYESLCR